MKKKSKRLTKRIGTFVMTVALVLSAIPMTSKASPTEFVWLGKDGKAKVETGLGDGTGDRWWAVNDKNDGGASELILSGNTDPFEYGAYISDEDVKKSGGISGVAKLKNGYDYPYIYIGFNIAGLDSESKAVVTDASGWDGISVAYECDTYLKLELGMGEAGDIAVGYDNPSVSLEPTAGECKVVSFAWSQFKQAGWGIGDKISGVDAANKLAVLRFKIEGKAGTECHFKIAGIGSKDANLTPSDYTVTFDTDGGPTVAAQNVATGSKATKPAEPTKEGYTFDNWYTDNTYTTVFDFDTAINKNTTIYAKWNEIKHNVTFETDGGTTIAAQNVVHGQKATKPAEPTKEGYIFDNWYTDNTYTTVFDFNNTSITADTTIYSKWNVKKYNVTFETDGGSAVAAQNVEHGQKAVKPANPTKAGFVFGGWYSDSGLTNPFNFEAPITTDTTAYAKWNSGSAPETYSVTFDTNGGGVVAAQNVTAGDKATKPADPTNAGYTFGGWYTDSTFTSTFDFNTAIIADKTIYAKWNSVVYNVTFETNGGNAIDTQSVSTGDKATKPVDPTKTGYTFGGWYSDSALTTEYSFDTGITANTTIYAKWNEIVKHTVTFNSKGGSPVAAQTVEHGKKVSLPDDPTKDGYTFDGWYSNSTLTTPFEFNTPITDDVMIYAKWIEKNGGNSGNNSGNTENNSSNSGNNISTGNPGDKGTTTSTTGTTTGDKKDNTTPTPAKEGTDLPDVTTGATYTSVASNNNEPAVSFKAPDTKSTSVTIPSTVTINGVNYKVVSVAENAFKDNKTLTTVTIDENVETIEANAFSGCINLKIVNLRSKVKTIKAGAFAGNTSLKRITIPASVVSIGKNAFKGCKNLKNVTIKTTKLTKKTLGANAFKGIHKKVVIKVPKKKLKDYKKILKKVGIKGKKQKIK